MNEISILFSINENYARYAEVLISSIIMTTRRRVVFYVAHTTDLSDRSVGRLRKLARRRGNGFVDLFFEKKEWMEDVEYRNWCTEAFLRLIVQYHVPDSIKKMLYIDIDTVVLSDIGQLFDVSIDNYYYGACVDGGINYDRDKDEYLYCDLDGTEEYYNGGVLLINCDALRETITESEVINNIISNSFIYADQSYLNKYYKKNICRLDENKFNCQINTKPIKKENDYVRSAIVVHFSSYPAWSLVCKRRSASYWWKYALSTNWYWRIRSIPWIIIRLIYIYPWRFLFFFKHRGEVA